MSEFDVTAATFLKNVLLPLAFGLILLVLLLKNLQSLRDRFFVFLYNKLMAANKDLVTTQKTALFHPLQDFRSLDRDLRNLGLVRILEIGIGSGTNFAFYPKNARVIAVDPNPFFQKSLFENKARFPEIKLEKVILGRGEDLSDVADDSVDVVVTTSVLCAVKELDVFLREVHRVLAPGGKYFFLEHTIAYDGTGWQRAIQRLGNVFWPIVFNGCEVTKDIEGAVRSAVGFEDIRFERFQPAKLPTIFVMFIGPHVYGTAQKTKKPKTA